MKKISFIKNIGNKTQKRIELKTERKYTKIIDWNDKCEKLRMLTKKVKHDRNNKEKTESMKYNEPFKRLFKKNFS